MQAHANLDIRTVGPFVGGEVALRAYGGVDRILRAPEGDKEGVALRIDLVAAVSRKREPEDPLVFAEHVGISRAKLA